MKEGGQTPVALKFSCTKTSDCPEALKIKGLEGGDGCIIRRYSRLSERCFFIDNG